MYTESSISELVASNQLYQYLSDKLDIPAEDYGKSFQQIGQERHLAPDYMSALVKSYDDTEPFPYEAIHGLSAEELTQYLRQSHRFYLVRKLPEMEQTAIQIARRFQDSDKLMSYLCLFFLEYKQKIADHILMEEHVLFPYIHKLILADELQADKQTLQRIFESFSAEQFLKDHTDIESELKEVRRVISSYQPEGNTPFPFMVFLNQLRYFEAELCRHAIIEDEILIPKVLAIEKRLKQKAGLSVGNASDHTFSAQ